MENGENHLFGVYEELNQRVFNELSVDIQSLVISFNILLFYLDSNTLNG